MENITNASDFVQNSLGKKTLVKLTNDEFYEGTLISIDGAFNLYLIDSKLVDENDDKDNKNKKDDKIFKNLFIRGNNVLYIAPYIS